MKGTDIKPFCEMNLSRQSIDIILNNSIDLQKKKKRVPFSLAELTLSGQ